VHDEWDVSLVVNVTLTIENLVDRFIRFLKAFLLDHRVPPTLQ
jgi:hypothetical protein